MASALLGPLVLLVLAALLALMSLLLVVLALLALACLALVVPIHPALAGVFALLLVWRIFASHYRFSSCDAFRREGGI